MKALNKTYTTLFKDETTRTQDATEKMKKDLEKERCSLFSFILSEFLVKEVGELTKSSEENKKLTSELVNQVKGLMNDDQKRELYTTIAKKNSEMVKSMCHSSGSGCLEFISSLSEIRLDLINIPDISSTLTSVAERVIIGPINSAFCVKKDVDDKIAPIFQASLLANGYVPSYQTASYDIFTCRGCLDTSKQVVEFDHRIPIDNIIAANYPQDIQDTVQSIDTRSQSEITTYFISKFDSANPLYAQKAYEITGIVGSIPKIPTKISTFGEYIRLIGMKPAKYDAVLTKLNERNEPHLILSQADDGDIFIVYTSMNHEAGTDADKICGGRLAGDCKVVDIEKNERFVYNFYSLFVGSAQNFIAKNKNWKAVGGVFTFNGKTVQVYSKLALEQYWLNPNMREGQEYSYFSDGPVERKSQLLASDDSLNKYLNDFSNNKSKDIIKALAHIMCFECWPNWRNKCC